jgi:hypothetical protein
MNSNYTSLSDDLYGMAKGLPQGPGNGPPPMMGPPQGFPQGPPMRPPPPQGPSELHHLRQMVQQMAAKINDMGGSFATAAADPSKTFTKYQTWSLGLLAVLAGLLTLFLFMFCKYAKRMSLSAAQVYSTV